MSVYTPRGREEFRIGPPPVLLARPGVQQPANPDWIAIEGSDADRIVEGLESFSRIGGHATPLEHDAALVRHESGLFGLFLSPRPVPLALVNLIAWLGDRGIIEMVSAACAWMRYGREGRRYLVCADRTNRSEDTVLALSDRDERVQIYLPDGSICPTSRRVPAIAEPLLSGETVKPLRRFKLTLDADRELGNPHFLTTHPTDHVWSL